MMQMMIGGGGGGGDMLLASPFPQENGGDCDLEMLEMLERNLEQEKMEIEFLQEGSASFGACLPINVKISPFLGTGGLRSLTARRSP